MHLRNSVLRVGVSVASLVIMGVGFWILYSVPVDADVMRQFPIGLSLPRPLLIISVTGAELILLHHIWTAQGREDDTRH